ncbi:Fc.00g065600.m01.CDS01 [Cosmosporella sp. VM-42]
MKYSIAAIAAFAALVVAKPAFTNSAFDVEEGKPFEITFSGCEGGCTIVLQNGDSDNTKDVETLTSSAEGDSFTFTPKGLPSDTYNFKITNNDSGEENFSAQFEYSGTGSLPTTGTTTAVTSTGSASASSKSSSAASSSAASTLSLTTVTTAVTTESKASSTVVSTSSVIETVTKNATTTHATSATKPTESASKTEASETTAAPTGSATTVPDSGAARMTSSLALVAGVIMAMIYLN